MKKTLLIISAGVFLVLLFFWKTGASEIKEGKKIKIFNTESGKYEEVETVTKDETEWRAILSDEQFKVMRNHGTERPFTGELLKNKGNGTYVCGACGTHLFSSETKYESGTGWPSFWQPIADENIGYTEDNALFMKRVEVHCPRCGAHLGHVFDDGPAPTHKRFCINSVSLKFKPVKSDE